MSDIFYQYNNSGENLTLLAGYGGSGISVGWIFAPPSGSTLEVSINLNENANATANIQGNNINGFGDSGNSSISLSNEDIVTIVIPPAADKIELSFFFDSVGYEGSLPELGSITFTNITLADPVIQGDLLKFSVTNGVRVLNQQWATNTPDPSGTNIPSDDKRENYPIYGETNSVVSARSGVITKKGNLNLGND